MRPFDRVTKEVVTEPVVEIIGEEIKVIHKVSVIEIRENIIDVSKTYDNLPKPPHDEIEEAKRLITYVIAAQPIIVNRIVSTNTDGKLVYADKDDIANYNTVLGLAMFNGEEGDNVKVLLKGCYTINTWSWIPRRTIYLGNNGVMTQDVPESGIIQYLAYAVSPQTIDFDIGNPYIFG